MIKLSCTEFTKNLKEKETIIYRSKLKFASEFCKPLEHELETFVSYMMTIHSSSKFLLIH